ncbi:myo-inosose-2 dehydratase [Halovulum sp. GXIMD14794]
MTIRLGISPIGWTNDAIADLGQDIALETCLSDAARAGFNGVEIGRKFPEDPAELRLAVSAHGLAPVTRWYSGYLSERDLAEEWPGAKAAAEVLIGLGCRVIVYGECGAGPEGGASAPLSRRPGTLGLATYADRLTALADRLAGIGITLVYHHHMMQPVETAAQIDALMEATGPSVRLLLDTGHLALAGDDYVPVMARWWDRIGHIHLKDVRRPVLDVLDRTASSFDDGVRLGMFTVPGGGDLDFAPVFEMVAARGYSGWIVVEAEQDPEIAAPALMARTAYDHVEALARRNDIPVERNPNHAR